MEITNKFYTVYYEETTNQGMNPIGIKHFTTLKEAKHYAQSYLEDLKVNAEDSDDRNRIVIEDEKRYTIKEWISEDGKVIETEEVKR